jgi:prepilin-type N-terminal cleavage/methylation domain-containing protein
MGRKGFTIVELIVVLTVVGVLASIAAPRIALGRLRTDSAVHEVMASLGAAQRLAVLRQHDVVVFFDLDGRGLRIHRDGDNDGVVDPGEDVRFLQLPETVGFGLGGAPGLSGDSGATTVTFSDDGAGSRLVFHRNGSGSEAGRIYLRPVEGPQSGDASSTRALTVERSTGEVRCLSYRTGSWEASC